MPVLLLAALGSLITVTLEIPFDSMLDLFPVSHCVALLWFSLSFQWKTSFSSFLRKGVHGSKHFAATHDLELSSALTFDPIVWPYEEFQEGKPSPLEFWKTCAIVLWLPKILEPEPFWPLVLCGRPIFSYPEAYRNFSVLCIYNFTGICVSASISGAGGLLGSFNVETHIQAFVFKYFLSDFPASFSSILSRSPITWMLKFLDWPPVYVFFPLFFYPFYFLGNSFSLLTIQGSFSLLLSCF